MIEYTEIRVLLSVRSAQSLMNWLRESERHDYRFKAYKAPTQGEVMDLRQTKRDLENLLLPEKLDE